MRLTLVIPSLGPGGAERVLSLLATEWARRNHRVVLVTLTPCGEDFFRVGRRVQRVGLGLASRPGGLRWITLNAARIRELRHVISSSQPDVVVSFLDAANLLTLLASIGSRVPVIISQRTDPHVHPIKPSHRALRRLLYRRATAVVVQTPAVAGWASTLTHSERVLVIPNPVAVVDRDASVERLPIVASIGRLDKPKGFDLLLEAFARIADAHPAWGLRIAGTGPEERRLIEQSIELGIDDRVRFCGLVTDTRRLLLESSLFVLSSRSEGFPNVVLEAMASGLPVVACDCSPGLRALVRNGTHGVLVPPDDADSLVEAIGRLMGNEHERRRLASAGIEHVRKFEVSSIADEWEALFNRVVSSPGSAIEQATVRLTNLPDR
jgi:glycosyltransferase involved in cell wall biosynthesis